MDEGTDLGYFNPRETNEPSELEIEVLTKR